MDGIEIINWGCSSRSIGRTNQKAGGGVDGNVAVANDSPIDVPEDLVDYLIANQQVIDQDRDDKEEDDEEKIIIDEVVV